MSSFEIELPVFTHRDLTSLQYLDGCRRITKAILYGTVKIPSEHHLVRESAEDCALQAEELACRLALDRKSEFARDKQQAHSQRVKYLQAMRREVKTILQNPDPALPAPKRAAAQQVLNALNKHHGAAQRRSQAELSASVRGLMAECAEDDLRRAIKQTGLDRFIDLLKETQERYTDLTKKEEAAAALAALPEPPATDSGESKTSTSAFTGKPRLAREIKDSLSDDLRFLFELMARQARRGREPYALLLAQGREIAAELNRVAKTRETREKKAEEKRQKKEGKGSTPTKESAPAPAVNSPLATLNGDGSRNVRSTADDASESPKIAASAAAAEVDSPLPG
jgi:hypothetical protein